MTTEAGSIERLLGHLSSRGLLLKRRWQEWLAITPPLALGCQIGLF